MQNGNNSSSAAAAAAGKDSFLSEDFGEDTEDDNNSQGAGCDIEDQQHQPHSPQLGLPRAKPKKIKNMPIEKLSLVYRFLLQVTEGLSSEQIKSVHQNPLQFVRTDKDAELLDLLAKDERFRGMMETYALFRDLIAQERLSRDKTVRSEQMHGQLNQLHCKLAYVESAMQILVKHLEKSQPLYQKAPSTQKDGAAACLAAADQYEMAVS